MVEFFPKPNNKIITVQEAVKNIKTKTCIWLNPECNTYKLWDKIRIGKSLASSTKTTSGFSLIKVNPLKPSPTIPKSLQLGNKRWAAHVHWSEKRSLSIEEIKRLCSYPDNWLLGNNIVKAWNRLGNSVMPKFMEAIAGHIKENILKKENPIVISMFCGTGGSSLGYKWAGYKELLAIDFDKHAIECFELNFPEVPCWHKSVLDIDINEILEFCNIKKGDLDVLDGSPPCQGFSIAGKRQVTDPRNDLFKRYFYFIKELQPKVFIMENVTGMMKGKMKGKFIEIMKTLKSINYIVKCKKMNAMYYNVPQSRERLIFIGIRNDIFANL